VAVGDVKSGLTSVEASGSLDIKPPSGEEWVIHNIYHEYDIELALTDGTNELVFDSDTGKGVYAKFSFHVTATIWLRVKNLDTANARLIGYDGVQTK